MTREELRLKACTEKNTHWKKWGPYLAERQWGVVREDYSANGEAWRYVTHDQARSKAYRWGEEGLAGISDDQQHLCLALALWNERDPFLKERLFGLAGPEGNHGEDVKEHYFYLDAAPTHAYLKMLYKYPQREFPYELLLRENSRRSRREPEYELQDTGIFNDDKYFDIFVEYAQAEPDDVIMRVTAHNRGPDTAPLHVLPTLWFRNSLSWQREGIAPRLFQTRRGEIEVHHHELGVYYFYVDPDAPLYFCDNTTNTERLYGTLGKSHFPKDAINDVVVNGHLHKANPAKSGTKTAAHFRTDIAAGTSTSFTVRLSAKKLYQPFAETEEILRTRRAETDEFYAHLQRELTSPDAALIQRQALAGMIWSKQYYNFDVAVWLRGDPGEVPPPDARRQGRNSDWQHMSGSDIISMPDKWEYPWFAAWDLAFHCIPLAMIDTEFAKQQLLLLTHEWYMHPNGQLPAYEWNFSDVNPPVHAWATWRVYKVDRKKHHGKGDLAFLERVYHKLLLNFTWWVNRKDAEGKNVFQGGFLGLDNIGVFDRSSVLPTGGHIEQCDGTSWMAMYCLNMMRIALELSRVNPSYQDMATKFFEHFLRVAAALTNLGGQGVNLWDEQEEFFFDVLHTPDHTMIPLKVRSIVGLTPLFAVETLEPEFLDTTPLFKERLEWFFKNRPEMTELVSHWQKPGMGERRLLSLLRGHRFKCLLRKLLDETEFLSDFGVRALSKRHEQKPYVFWTEGEVFSVNYQPAEADTGLFGGNSNWRGPIWLPINFLIIESLQKFYHYYGPDFKIECPTGSGNYMTILDVAEELTSRLTKIFLRDAHGRRAVFGKSDLFHGDPHWRDYIPFYEYFHGDNGSGLGASHQTGWTGLIAKLLQPRHDRIKDKHTS